MEDNSDNRKEEIFSRKIRVGKKRTYFIDVRPTRKNDYYITITESKRKLGEDQKLIKHKIFLYKEDFNKFQEGLNDAVDYVKNELLPDFDFEKFDRKEATTSEENASEGSEESDEWGLSEDTGNYDEKSFETSEFGISSDGDPESENSSSGSTS
jgi:hypothetical protein